MKRLITLKIPFITVFLLNTYQKRVMLTNALKAMVKEAFNASIL
jgi:hypothetical protein